jgi:DNA polymerase I
MPRLLGVDTETHLIRPGVLAPKLVCVSLSYSAGTFLHDADRGATAFEYALDEGDTLVLHNASYDLAVLTTYRPHLMPKVFKALDEGRIKDTQIRQKLIDIARGCHQRPRHDGSMGYTLADLERHYLGLDRTSEKNDPNGWRRRYAELDGTPISEWPLDARTYAEADAVGALAVYQAQAERHAGEINTEDDQLRAAWALHLMSVHGVITNGERVRALKTYLEQRRVKFFRRLQKGGLYKGRRAAPDETPDYYEAGKKGPRPMKYAKDTKAIQARVVAAYDRQGRPTPLTDTGRVSTDRDTLNNSRDRYLILMGGIGGIDKILTTYIPALELGVSAPVNVRFDPIKDTGRTSSYGSKNEDTGAREGFNIQNLPTGRRVGGVRECIEPRPGNYFCSVDYDTAELRSLAQVLVEMFGESAMADALRAGRELHLDFAAKQLGVEYEEAVARYQAKDKVVKKSRDLGKVGNFGIPGGLGPDALVDFARAQYGVRLTYQQAKALKYEWLRVYPEMRRFFQYASDRVGEGAATFRDPVTGFVRGGCIYTQFCNTHFQHRTAFGAKQAAYEVARECYVDCGTALFGTRPVAFIHDEILAEVPIATAHEAAMRLAEVMCDVMARYVSAVPITASPALMTRWLKGAEAKYVDGRLVPWA